MLCDSCEVRTESRFHFVVLLSTLLRDILHPSHHLLKVLLHIANKLGLSNKKKCNSQRGNAVGPCTYRELCPPQPISALSLQLKQKTGDLMVLLSSKVSPLQLFQTVWRMCYEAHVYNFSVPMSCWQKPYTCVWMNKYEWMGGRANECRYYSISPTSSSVGRFLFPKYIWYIVLRERFLIPLEHDWRFGGILCFNTN
jgi:hypothetical protein